MKNDPNYPRLLVKFLMNLGFSKKDSVNFLCINKDIFLNIILNSYPHNKIIHGEVRYYPNRTKLVFNVLKKTIKTLLGKQK